MIYALNDLLMKMGAPEVKRRGRIEWHYFDRRDDALAGFAEIRLGAGGEHLIAELKHIRENYEDDKGAFHRTYTESFYLYAERMADGAHYRIKKICFDGEEYADPAKGVIELGLSLFHARALDISIRMIEQTFNKQDITDAKEEEAAKTGLPAFAPPAALKRDAAEFSVVIPFRPRHAPANGDART
ncbi:MAG: hypothetical protein GC185_05480 [Alphaproteobacteria bacterium]|nr:hypothetical protein [Alphaproteobacteria bacterium]